MAAAIAAEPSAVEGAAVEAVESAEGAPKCGGCDNCVAKEPLSEVDVSDSAAAAIRAVSRMSSALSFGVRHRLRTHTHTHTLPRQSVVARSSLPNVVLQQPF